MTLLTRRSLALPIAAALSLALAVPALAQQEAPKTTISRIDAGEAVGTVYLEGAALEQIDGEAYLFSDGTGMIVLEIENVPASAVPMNQAVDVFGEVDTDDGKIEVDVKGIQPSPKA